MSASEPYVPRRRVAAHHPGLAAPSRLTQIETWWREIDKVLLGLVLLLMAIGLAAVASASPATAERLSSAKETVAPMHFFWLDLRWQMVGLMVLLAASTLSIDNARRLGILFGLAMLAGLFLVLVPFLGHEVKGSRRWLNLGVSFQPSEFFKPGFSILLAWMLSWRLREPNLPMLPLACGFLGLVAILLMAQPNLGETVLIGFVWLTVMLLAGLRMRHLAMFAGTAIAGLGLAYTFYDNARFRIDSFFGDATPYDQVDLAQRTLLGGGWTGAGFLMGTQKMRLPEAHTDYIFSVIGEDFGLLICALVVCLYLAIVVRALTRLADQRNYFALLAAGGITAQIGGQAFINILVNLKLFPAKGMTLPLVSYGGSSTIAICLTIGLLLALTRRNPFFGRETEGLRWPLRQGGAA